VLGRQGLQCRLQVQLATIAAYYCSFQCICVVPCKPCQPCPQHMWQHACRPTYIASVTSVPTTPPALHHTHAAAMQHAVVPFGAASYHACLSLPKCIGMLLGPLASIIGYGYCIIMSSLDNEGQGKAGGILWILCAAQPPPRVLSSH
jgi:hypothetical protein